MRLHPVPASLLHQLKEDREGLAAEVVVVVEGEVVARQRDLAAREGRAEEAHRAALEVLAVVVREGQEQVARVLVVHLVHKMERAVHRREQEQMERTDQEPGREPAEQVVRQRVRARMGQEPEREPMEQVALERVQGPTAQAAHLHNNRSPHHCRLQLLPLPLNQRPSLHCWVNTGMNIICPLLCRRQMTFVLTLLSNRRNGTIWYKCIGCC